MSRLIYYKNLTQSYLNLNKLYGGSTPPTTGKSIASALQTSSGSEDQREGGAYAGPASPPVTDDSKTLALLTGSKDDSHEGASAGPASPPVTDDSKPLALPIGSKDDPHEGASSGPISQKVRDDSKSSSSSTESEQKPQGGVSSRSTTNYKESKGAEPLPPEVPPAVAQAFPNGAVGLNGDIYY